MRLFLAFLLLSCVAGIALRNRSERTRNILLGLMCLIMAFCYYQIESVW